MSRITSQSIDSRVLIAFAVALLIGMGILIAIAAFVFHLLFRGWVEHRNVSFDVSPKGDVLCFAAADGNLYCLDLKTMHVTPFVASSIEKSDPAFSPDGTEIVYTEGTGLAEGKHLYIRSIDGKHVRQLTRDPNVYDIEPSFSRDGKRVCFSRAALHRLYSMGGWTWDQYDLWVVNTDGANLHQLTHQNYYQLLHPLFMKDNKRLVYEAYQEGTGALYTVAEKPGSIPRPFGGRPKGNVSIGSWAGDAHLSADGTRFAFISDRASPFKYDVWLMNADETNVHSLGLNKVSNHNQNPVFMPDDRRLLFLAGTETGAGNRPMFSLWQVDLGSRYSHQIADSGLFSDPLHWKAKK